MMDNNPPNEEHPESASTEDSEQNVEMPSHTEESLPAIPSSAPATPKADKTPKSKFIFLIRIEAEVMSTFFKKHYSYCCSLSCWWSSNHETKEVGSRLHTDNWLHCFLYQEKTYTAKIRFTCMIHLSLNLQHNYLLFLFTVLLCQPIICTFSWPISPKSFWLLWLWWQVDFGLL